MTRFEFLAGLESDLHPAMDCTNTREKQAVMRGFGGGGREIFLLRIINYRAPSASLLDE